MRQRFFVFVRCAPGKAYDIGLQLLENHPEIVTEVHSVSGEWDLLLRAEFDSSQNFGLALGNVLGDIVGVERTHTFVAYLIWDPDDVYFDEDD